MAQQSSRESSDADSSEPAYILVVDDEEQIWTLLSNVLRGFGHRVEARRDGREGVQALSSRAFDLVITDLAMPVQSGEAVLAAAKALDPDLPVVVITAYPSTYDEARLRDLGADEFIAKPFDIGYLASVVERLLLRPRD